jgi:threonine/homoserine/homoserine lactone efflux protein
MDPIWFNFASFLAVYVFAIVSPGPNFILVLNAALSGSRRSGLFTAFGVATGSGLFGFAGLAGLLVVINSLPNFAVIGRVVGGGYLVWLGLGMMRNGIRKNRNGNHGMPQREETPFRAWQTGLFTNLTNPKAWAFYFALFTVVITPGFLIWHKALLNLSMFLISFSWYAFVAVMISSRRFRPLFDKTQQLVQLLLGLMLVVLGGRIFFLPWEIQ